jgi:hypothetical protein
MITTDPKLERKYVLVRERTLPPEKRRTFWLHGLTAREEHQAIDIGQGTDADGSPRVNIGSIHFFMLGCGLARWENVRDKAGVEQKLELDPRTGRASEESLGLLTLSERMEIAKAIESGASVTEAELEPSGQPSNQPSGT